MFTLDAHAYHAYHVIHHRKQTFAHPLIRVSATASRGTPPESSFILLEKMPQVADLATVRQQNCPARLLGLQDEQTLAHSRRTQGYVALLGRRLQALPAYQETLSDAMLQRIIQGAFLHDVGKAGIPPEILHKPGRLTREEFEIIKTHSLRGHQAIEVARAAARRQRLGQSTQGFRNPPDYLETASVMALYHHEKWDGTGYPFGLAGFDIPLAARIMAVADVFDALSSRRSYKDPTPVNDIVMFIAEGRETHFDPAIIDVFLKFKRDFILALRHNLGR